MPEDRLSQPRKEYAEDDYFGLEPPDLGPLRGLAETAEFADAVARLSDAYGRPAAQETTGWPDVDGSQAVGEDGDVNINDAAVAAYRASVDVGRPLSERKLAALFGKTSRRWARHRMAEAMGRVVG